MAGIGASRPRPEESRHAPFVLHTRRSRAVNAAAIAAALSLRAEAVCRQYLPHGRRQGRYWVAGDLDGARGRSLYVRLRGPGTPGKWTDAADGSHGDLLDLVRHRSRAPTLRAALDEARAFLALPAAPADGRELGRRLRRDAGRPPSLGALPRHRRYACGSVPPRPGARALPLLLLTLPPRASLPRRLDGAPPPGAGRRRDRR